jgi:AP-2 complex subunit alpha
MSSLAGLDLSNPTAPTQSASLDTLLVDAPPSILAASVVTSPAAITPAVTVPTMRKPSTPLTHGADKWLSRLVYNSEGVLWEDGQLQVGVKSEFHGHLGRIALFFGNKISVPLESFTATIEVPEPDALNVTLPKIPTTTLGAMDQIQQLVHVECKNLFTQPPILKISYLAGSLQTIVLKLPIYLLKFLEPVQLSQPDFFERWKQIGGPPREAQSIFSITLESGGGVDRKKNRKVVSGTRFGVLEGFEGNENNLVAAAVLHMSEGGKVGCLLRLEPNVEAKVSAIERACEDRRLMLDPTCSSVD